MTSASDRPPPIRAKRSLGTVLAAITVGVVGLGVGGAFVVSRASSTSLPTGDPRFDTPSATVATAPSIPSAPPEPTVTATSGPSSAAPDAMVAAPPVGDASPRPLHGANGNRPLVIKPIASTSSTPVTATVPAVPLRPPPPPMDPGSIR